MKILFFDIETAPNRAYVWGKYEQNVIDYDKQWYMLCFAYKWLGQKTTKAHSLPDFDSFAKDKEDDRELVKKLWDLFDEADIIIAHNGDQFDIKKSNAKFVEHGLQPPRPYKTIDTKKLARRYFMFNSNKLDDLGELFNLGRKIDTGGFELWLGCMDGDMKAWNKMVRYNKQDVDLLEKVYLELRPWFETHPNLNVVDEKENACPACGSQDIQKRGHGYTQVGKYQRYQCKCGKWSKGKVIRTLVEIR